MTKKNLGLKRFLVRNNFGSKKHGVQKNFGSKKVLGPKNLGSLDLIDFRSKKIWVERNSDSIYYAVFQWDNKWTSIFPVT